MAQPMEFADDPVVSIYKGKKGVPSMKYRMALQLDPPNLSLVGIQDLCGSTVGHRSVLGNLLRGMPSDDFG